jgi:Glycoside-hydrolase family GH114/N-terminal glycosyl-hydrolase-114-associated domain/Fibronectin type III domain
MTQSTMAIGRRFAAGLLAVGIAAGFGIVGTGAANAATTTISPSTLVSTKGSVATGQTVANLAVKDQSGTADTFSKYVEFDSTATGYAGYRQYSLPPSLAPSTVTGVAVTANYKGPTTAEQAWSWSLFNWSTAQWTTIGSNSGASSWVWKSFTFASPASAASFVSPTGAVRVQFSATTGVDNALLDYEAITVTSGAAVVDATAPTAPTSVTSPSKTANSVTLSWTGSTDNVGVAGYEVFVNGSGTPTSSPTTTATVPGLTSNTAYSFTVKAKDAAGNRSAASTPLSVTTSAAATVGFALPPANGKWDYQIGGPYTPPAGVQVVSRDRTVAPVPGLYNICYVNVMQTQPNEPGQSATNPPYGTTAWWLKNHPNVILKDAAGNPIIDDVWKEVVFDVRTAAKRAELAAVQKPWIQGCKDAGYQAIEPDNIDAEVRSSGYLTHTDVREYMKLLVPYAHSIGLAIGQKNAITANSEAPGAPDSLEWVTDGPSFVTVNGITQGFDFAIAEECGQFEECGEFVKMYGGRVFVVEYTATGFTKACAEQRARLSIIQRNVDVRPSSASGWLYTEC